MMADLRQGKIGSAPGQVHGDVACRTRTRGVGSPRLAGSVIQGQDQVRGGLPHDVAIVIAALASGMRDFATDLGGAEVEIRRPVQAGERTVTG